MLDSQKSPVMEASTEILFLITLGKHITSPCPPRLGINIVLLYYKLSDDYGSIVRVIMKIISRLLLLLIHLLAATATVSSSSSSMLFTTNCQLDTDTLAKSNHMLCIMVAVVVSVVRQIISML